MRPSERRVVITGIGIATPLGIGPAANWEGLMAGRTAIAPVEAFPVGDVPTNLAGEVRGFDIKALASPRHKKALVKNQKYMARDIFLAVGTAEIALQDAGLIEPGAVDPTRLGIDLGAALISTELDELSPAIDASTRPDGSFDFPTWGKDGLPQILPIWLLRYLPNMLACHIGILNDCQGPSNTITESDAASNVAISEATRIIQRGRADVMISGGGDSKIHPLGYVRGALYGILTHERDPNKACRPFAKDCDGVVPGEGAAIVILEELEHAKARGVHIYGEVLGCGLACDGYERGGMDPNGKGTELAVRRAIEDAGLEPSQIGHVNAHGASIPTSDLAEARAFERVFGPNAVPVTAMKGFMGNMGASCGAVELVLSLMGVNQGLIPPAIHCDELNPECHIDLVRGGARPTDNPTFVSNNLTRYGQAAAVVVRGNRGGTEI
jgi:3-oxoacyl-[acyl-carrier-protein] synthase II